MTLQEKFDLILDYEIRQLQVQQYILDAATDIRDVYDRIIQYFGTQQIGELFPDSARPFTELDILIQKKLESIIMNY